MKDLEPCCQKACQDELARVLAGCSHEDGTPLNIGEGVNAARKAVKNHNPQTRQMG